MTYRGCPACGAPCDEDGECTFERTHPPAGDDVRAETLDRIRHFLAQSPEMADDEPMWMVDGIRLNWGDLRLLVQFAEAL